MVEMRRRVQTPAFFAYGLITRTSTRLTTEIISVLATSTPVMAFILILSNRNKAAIINAMQSNTQILQWQCRRCQCFVRDWSHYNHYT